MSKSVLLLKLLDMLRTQSNLTVADIALELGRSERTAFRYLQELGDELNMPVYFEGGYKLINRERLTPINFTQEEALALRLALGATPILKTSPINAHAASALNKVQAAMSDSSHRASVAAKGKVTLSVPAHENLGQKESFLRIIEDAVIRQRTLLLMYQSLESSAPKSRLFDPYALAFRKHNWYLIGNCHSRKKIIQLKVARITNVRIQEARFETPADFSVETFYEHSWGLLTGDVVKVEILFKPSVARLILESRRISSQETHKNKDGSVSFTAEVAGFAEIGWWALSFGDQAEVIGPPEFKEWVRDQVEKLCSVYLK